MKHLLAVFAAMGLLSVADSAKAEAQAISIDMSWALQTAPRVHPNVPQSGACAYQLAQQYYDYVKALREHGYDKQLPTDFVAKPCQSAPQPLVDCQFVKPATTLGQPETISEPFSDCTGPRRVK